VDGTRRQNRFVRRFGAYFAEYRACVSTITFYQVDGARVPRRSTEHKHTYRVFGSVRSKVNTTRDSVNTRPTRSSIVYTGRLYVSNISRSKTYTRIRSPFRCLVRLCWGRSNSPARFRPEYTRETTKPENPNSAEDETYEIARRVYL